MYMRYREPLSPTPERAMSRDRARLVFESVYDQIRRGMLGKDEQERAKSLMFEIKYGVQRRIEPLANSGKLNTHLYDEMQAKISSVLANIPEKDRAPYEQDAFGLLRKFQTSVNDLVVKKTVQPLVAKVFIQSLPTLYRMGEYGALVKNSDVRDLDIQEQNIRYEKGTKAVYDSWVGNKSLQDNYFYHFNSDQKDITRNRLYISAQPGRDPLQVVHSWMSALEKNGLKSAVHFKIPAKLNDRFETIVVYPGEKIDQQKFAEALRYFQKNSPRDQFSDVEMPTGISIGPGMSVAPEPANVNRLLKYLGDYTSTMSYNQLIAGVMQLSLEFAFYEKQLKGEVATRPVELKSLAEQFFLQCIELSGLDPKTMMPKNQQGKLPEWARLVIEHTD